MSDKTRNIINAVLLGVLLLCVVIWAVMVFGPVEGTGQPHQGCICTVNGTITPTTEAQYAQCVTQTAEALPWWHFGRP